MKNLRFALCGMVILLSALLIVFAACSLNEIEQPVIDGTEEDDPAANEESPETDEEGTSSEDPLPDDPLDPSSQLPSILINELFAEYRGSDFIAEYIEFKILSAGNLEGLQVVVVSNRAIPFVYEFLSVTVDEGEYVTLHLRTLEESCVNEYGEDLTVSGGTHSSPKGRDIWVPGDTKYLGRTGAVYIMDQNDKILDAVLFAEDPIPTRSLAPFNAALEFLYTHGAWTAADGTKPSHDDAVKTSSLGTAYTRSISRDETVSDTNTAADWYITANYGKSPGVKNDPKRL
ncbi:MAG: hypothetical protein FWD13_11575 [Treponema sp.]|nr:hypothetical protein [Treponema sp.]